MPWCVECGYREGTMFIDGEWICEYCTSGISDEDDEYPDFTDEHDPDCPCEECQENARETQIAFDLGLIP